MNSGSRFCIFAHSTLFQNYPKGFYCRNKLNLDHFVDSVDTLPNLNKKLMIKFFGSSGTVKFFLNVCFMEIAGLATGWDRNISYISYFECNFLRVRLQWVCLVIMAVCNYLIKIVIRY